MTSQTPTHLRLPHPSRGDSDPVCLTTHFITYVSHRRSICDESRSSAAGRFLGELNAGGEAEFGVDVGEVGSHGAR